MKNLLTYQKEKQGLYVEYSMVALSVLMIVFAFICDSPWEIGAGVVRIIMTQAGLITDSIVVGGLGGAFMNAGLVTLLSIFLLRLTHVNFTGMTIACLFLMAGFSLFGKDIFNILPIILGGYLYAKYKGEPYSKYIYISMYGTALAPVVTEVTSIGSNGNPNPVLGFLVGVFIGFILPPISAYTLRVHQGYNLYNVGFTAGLIGMVLASLLKSFGLNFETRLEWSTGYNLLLGGFLVVLFVSMLVADRKRLSG